MNVYVKCHGVGLELPLDLQRPDTGDAAGSFRATLGRSTRRYVRVLGGIELTAEDGDRFAVMGLNGAGKTTLLRVVNGALAPSVGVVRTSGTMQSLLNSGLGFHEHASVSENVFLRGTAIGLRMRQLQSALPGILDFAGLRDCAGHRLHTLSAGQRLRLGFAISTAVQPDILLLDEWLATGDASFVERARARLLDRVEGSRIVFLASHNTPLQREICNKAIVLDKGRMVHCGSFDDGMVRYLDLLSRADVGQRNQAAAADPVLFGESVGLIERMLEDDDGLWIEGWAISREGREVSTLCLEFDGRSTFVEQFEKVERDDVRRYLNKRSGKFGFRFRHPVPLGARDAAICGIKLSAGSSSGRLGPMLPLAAGAIVKRNTDRR